MPKILAILGAGALLALIVAGIQSNPPRKDTMASRLGIGEAECLRRFKADPRTYEIASDVCSKPLGSDSPRP